MPPKHTRKVQLGINCTYLVPLPLIFGNSVCIGADVSQLIVLFHFVMFRMEWSRGKAVEFILKILSSKLDGTSSIFLEKVTVLLYRYHFNMFSLLFNFCTNNQGILLMRKKEYIDC